MKKYLITVVAFGAFLQWGISSMNLTERAKVYADSRQAQLDSVLQLEPVALTLQAKNHLQSNLQAQPGCERAAQTLSGYNSMTESQFKQWLAQSKPGCATLSMYGSAR